MTNKHPSKLDGLCMDASTVSGLMLPVSAAEEGQEEKKNFQTITGFLNRLAIVNPNLGFIANSCPIRNIGRLVEELLWSIRFDHPVDTRDI
ncbi:unnamed protein product [Rhizophagus irregularis]|nr:unnamed protein product [Rhizophagus irregularis]